MKFSNVENVWQLSESLQVFETIVYSEHTDVETSQWREKK
jgi:hypothetical protein